MPKEKNPKVLEQDQTTTNSKSLFIIGIGASAGGLEALQDFLSNLPTNLSNVAIIIAQHMSPTHKSMLVQLLSRETRLQVSEALHGEVIEENKVYITPPDKDIAIVGDAIELRKTIMPTGPKPCVDVLFNSMASSIGTRSIGVILSGTGTDGAVGLKALKEAGAITIAQEPQTAKYNGMPLAAIETGAVDMVLPPDKMGEEIKESLMHPGQTRVFANTIPPDDSPLGKIFRILSERAGTDFSNYKPSTICRRLEKRFVTLKMSNIEDYVEYLMKTPGEAEALFNNILIGVTSFFRDPNAYNALRGILEKIIAGKKVGDPIRIWAPGCATGEEAYSIAILLSDLLKGKTQEYNIQIFATDIDEEAIAHARKAIYEEPSLKGLPKNFIKTYFIQKFDKYELIKPIRSLVLFSRHDLVSNPPFLKLDLLSCRNLLIYFGGNLQKHIIPVFHYALNPNGYLFLGKSETVGQFSDLFATLDGKSKIFQRKLGNALHTIKLSAFKTGKTIAQPNPKKVAKQELSIAELVKETLYINYDHPYAIVNDTFDIVEIFGSVQNYLSLPSGAMNVNILKMIRQDLLIELRSLLAKSHKDVAECKSSIKKIKLGEQTSYIRIHIKPLIAGGDQNKLSLVIFEEMDMEDLTIYTEKINSDDTESGFLRIKELEHELAATKEHLQTYIEELETTNEELQSTNEEIQIAYAELKMNNEELNKKEQQLHEVQKNVQALLNNTLQGFVLVDHTYKIITFNEQAHHLWQKLNRKNLHKDDSIIDYLPSDQLSGFIEQFQKCLTGETINTQYTFKTSQNKELITQINFTPVIDSSSKVTVISIGILDITKEIKVIKKLQSAEHMFSSLFESANIGINVTDKAGYIKKVNPMFCEIFKYEKDELIDKNITDLLVESDREAAVKVHDNVFAGVNTGPKEWSCIRKDGKIIHVYQNFNIFKDQDGELYKVTTTTDITERKNADRLFEEAANLAKLGWWELDLGTQTLYWSDIVKKIHEVEPNYIPQLATGINFYKEGPSRRLIQEAVKKAIEEQKIYDLELQIITATGKEKWVRASGRPIIVDGKVSRLIGIFQDIQSYKTIQADLKVFSQMVEQSPSSIVVTDSNGSIEYVNPAFCNTTGYSFNEAIGKNPRILKSGITPDSTYADMWRDLSNGKTWNGVLCNKKKNGELYWESASIAPIIDSEGKTISYVAIKDNITEKVLLEKQLKEEQNDFQKKMTDAIIAAQEKERTEIGRELHDNINQLLASAKMFLKFSRNDEESYHQTEMILQNAIDEIRKLSHLLVLPTVINSKLAETIDTIVYELKGSSDTLIHKEIINFDDYDVSHNLKMNIYHIIQIQLNNIYKHAKAKNIWIYIINHEQSKTIDISIKDDGIGFDPKKRTSGIGLLNIRTRASLFDGKVEVISSPGNGCEVIVTLNT
ncbi:MAG: PAS domain S-box protein [Chitinophagaceae bacterium]|nr:PAS domain S-box protein [Chitinophagaceae bacterium]